MRSVVGDRVDQSQKLEKGIMHHEIASGGMVMIMMMIILKPKPPLSPTKAEN